MCLLLDGSAEAASDYVDSACLWTLPACCPPWTRARAWTRSRACDVEPAGPGPAGERVSVPLSSCYRHPCRCRGDGGREGGVSEGVFSLFFLNPTLFLCSVGSMHHVVSGTVVIVKRDFEVAAVVCDCDTGKATVNPAAAAGLAGWQSSKQARSSRPPRSALLPPSLPGALTTVRCAAAGEGGRPGARDERLYHPFLELFYHSAPLCPQMNRQAPGRLRCSPKCDYGETIHVSPTYLKRLLNHELMQHDRGGSLTIGPARTCPGPRRSSAFAPWQESSPLYPSADPCQYGFESRLVPTACFMIPRIVPEEFLPFLLRFAGKSLVLLLDPPKKLIGAAQAVALDDMVLLRGSGGSLRYQGIQ
jgi:hypothetical protein